jgi:hypothetical protein
MTCINYPRASPLISLLIMRFGLTLNYQLTKLRNYQIACETDAACTETETEVSLPPA